MQDRKERVAWLKSLRVSAQEIIGRIEAGRPLLGCEGDAHMRDATELWLQQNRAFAAKLERRIAVEERLLT